MKPYYAFIFFGLSIVGIMGSSLSLHAMYNEEDVQSSYRSGSPMSSPTMRRRNTSNSENMAPMPHIMYRNEGRFESIEVGDDDSIYCDCCCENTICVCGFGVTGCLLSLLFYTKQAIGS